jgi:hypothetical protein
MNDRWPLSGNTGEHPRSLFTANPLADVAFQLTEEQNKSSGV